LRYDEANVRQPEFLTELLLDETDDLDPTPPA